MTKIKVLFVCLGNICRSPMAEFLFKDLVKNKGRESLFEIDSKATSTYEIGNDTYYGTKELLDSKNIEYTKRRASQITKNDFYYYDYIIGMDHSNINNLKKIAPKETLNKIYLMLDINENTKSQIVPDPWYTRDFDETYLLLKSALNDWYNYMINRTGTN